MNQATPRPWTMELGQVGEDIVNIILDESGNIGIAMLGQKGELDGLSAANAKLIVKAVNCHDELVEALQLVLEETGKECYCNNEYKCGRCKAKQALQKAGAI